MRCLAIIIFIVISHSLFLSAMPAYPKKIAVKTVEGDTFIRLSGDENYKHAESEDGYSLVHIGEKWFYAELTNNGTVAASSHELTKNPKGETKRFLENTPQHLYPSKSRKTASESFFRTTIKPIGKRRIIVILMEFCDVPMVKERGDFSNLFNKTGYHEDGAIGSVADYYKDVSYGQLSLVCDIIGPFVTKQKRAYYGGNNFYGNDKNALELFNEAIAQASKELDLSKYDADGDGYVDNVHIIFSGHGEEAGATSDAIWSHEATLPFPVVFQNKRIDRYSCAPELRDKSGYGISRIGPHCHEIGHALGALDYYDTNYEQQGEYHGTGQWDIMAEGAWNDDGIAPSDFNPYVKMHDFGWIKPTELPEGEVLIESSALTANSYYRLSNSEDDYYLLENRSVHKWGCALPGNGLLLFHIHPTIEASRRTNTVNTTHPQKCYPVYAAATRNLSSTYSHYGDINSSRCTFPGTSRKTVFNKSSTPNAFAWDGSISAIDIRNIYQYSDGSIRVQNNSNSNVLGKEEILFNESFEEASSYITEEVNGNTSWIQVTTANGGLKEAIRPKTGNAYLCFMPGKMSNGTQKSILSFHIDNPHHIEEPSLQLYYQLSGNKEKPTLQIACNSENDSFTTIYNESNDSKEWQIYSCQLPTEESYTLKICGTASYGQSICLDDIQIKGIATSGIISTGEKVQGNYCVFNLFGRCTPQLRKGLNIVRISDGTVKKIIIR